VQAETDNIILCGWRSQLDEFFSAFDHESKKFWAMLGFESYSIYSKTITVNPEFAET